MMYSEICKLVRMDKERKVTVPSGSYTKTDLYSFMGTAFRESFVNENTNNKKYVYKVEILKHEITVSLNLHAYLYTDDAPDVRIEVNKVVEQENQTKYISSMDGWSEIPNDVLYHLICVKNLIEDFKKDKIPWPFSEEELAKRV